MLLLLPAWSHLCKHELPQHELAVPWETTKALSYPRGGPCDQAACLSRDPNGVEKALFENDRWGDSRPHALTNNASSTEEKQLWELRTELTGASRSSRFFHVLFNQVEEVVVSRLCLWLDGRLFEMLWNRIVELGLIG